jgi:hypothetical protein
VPLKKQKYFEWVKAEYQLHFIIFAAHTVAVAQLVRASDCGSEGRGFETPQSPKGLLATGDLFICH